MNEPKLQSRWHTSRKFLTDLLDLSALEERQLRRLVQAQLASFSGDLLVFAAMPAAVTAIGGSASLLGTVLGAQALSLAFFFVVGGVVGDRFNRRTVAVCADVMCFASQLAMALLFILGDATFWQLLVAQVIQGAGLALSLTALNGLIPEAVASWRLQEANALLAVARAVGAFTGPLVAGGILALGLGPGWAFVADSLTFLASAQCLGRIKLRWRGRGDSHSLASDLRAGWREFWSKSWIWAVVMEFALLNAAAIAPFFVIGPTLPEELLPGPGGWPVILAAMGLGEILGGLVAKVWRPDRPLLAAVLAAAAWGLPLALVTLLAPAAVVAIGVAIGGAGLVLFEALWMTTLQSQVSSGFRSRVASFDFLGSRGLVFLGYVLGGVAADSVGPQLALLGSLVVLAVATCLVASLRSIRTLTVDIETQCESNDDLAGADQSRASAAGRAAVLHGAGL